MGYYTQHLKMLYTMTLGHVSATVVRIVNCYPQEKIAMLITQEYESSLH